MGNMTRKNKTIEIKLLSLLVAGIFIMSCFYAYFLNLTVANIIAKKQNSRQIQKLALEEQKLEKNYFGILKQLNLEYADSLGFVAQRQTEIAVRQTSMARR